MHHTVHLFYKCNTHEFSALFKALAQVSEDRGCKFYEIYKESLYRFELLKKNGIQIQLVQVSFEDGISYRAVELIMNPMRLLNGEDYISLASQSYRSQIEKAFHQIWALVKERFNHTRINPNLKFKLDLLSSYKVKRIDIATNLHVPYPEIYMKLIRRSNIPKGFQLYTEFNAIGKRHVPPKDSFYIFREKLGKEGNRSKKSITINCYNKNVQLHENNLNGAEQIRNIIRFEVQCHYDKVYRITKSKKFENQSYFQFIEEELSNSIIQAYFKKTIGFGDYYSLSAAKKVLMQSSVRQSTKDKLSDTLDLVSQKRSIAKASEASKDKKKFNENINKLNKLGINAVTIPFSEKLEFLPCIFEYFLEELI
ncbi:hypothetical protein [Saccharibacillus brassicae]|uniref:Uncharacterized protein n=1 Tax=Saccharibacillus brassicae TaxID=2583377 RepID=A0A4Y6UTU6_SACBS|nr:hypothetical protein [Saccharibacillus brassicae]QDH19796.1 hypothetical protein FFV09_02285 [Saccharibacillus brassicae]